MNKKLSKKLLVSSLLLLLAMGNSFTAFSITTATTAAGAWPTVGNWNNGAPTAVGIWVVTVNTGNAMTGVAAVSLNTGAYYTIKANLAGGTNLTVATGSTFEVQAGTSTFSGTGSITGTLIVRSGATLNINSSITFNAGAIILIESGGILNTGGSFSNNSTSGVQVDGLISASGSVANNGTIYGNGNVTSVGSMSNAGTSFGNTGGLGCLGGCSANQLCTTNTITSSTPMCSSGSVSAISGNGIALAFYQWQSSTTGTEASFANIGGATSQNYTPGALSTTTYYRRKVTTALGLGCVSNSPAIVAIVPTVSVSPTTASPCAGASTVITATPSGGTGPYTYTWSPSTNLSSTTSVNPTATPTVNTVYTVSVLDNNGCGTATATSTFTVTPLPVISQIPGSLQSRYKLDGNGLDAQAVNNGTLQNAPTPTTDRFGNVNSAYSFDGSSQYISTAVSYPNPSQFSLALWFQTTTSVGGRLIGFGDASTGASGNRDRMAWMDNTGNIVFAVNPGAGYQLFSTKSYNDGSWHQLVITCSSTAGHGTNMYVDGALVATNTSALGGQSYTGFWRINYDAIGWSDSPSSNYFKGSMDDVMIFNTELTSSNVTTLYNTPDGAGSNSPICLGGSLSLTSTTLATATYSWSGPNSFSSSSQNPSAITNMSSINEGVYTVTVTKSGCNSTAYVIAQIDYTLGTSITQIPSSGNIANYKFNGNANDATGTNHGSLQNAPTLTTDRFGISNAAYTFNGSSQYVSTNKSYINPSNLSVSIWFKTNSSSGGKLIGFGNTQTGGSSNFDRHIYMDNTGKIYFGVNPSSGRITINSTLTYNDNTWHLATATLSSTTGIVLYIDGVQVASNSTPLGGEIYTGYYKIGFDAIGATWPANPTSPYFNGALDDILIYTRALTATEVATLYNGPDGPGQNGPVCVGSTLTFSAPTVGGASYVWTGPGTFLPSAVVQSPTMTYSLANAGIYTLNVTAGGCISRAYTIVSTNTVNAGQWTGNTNTSWQTAGNWCGGVLPSSTTNVTIPVVTNLPVNNGTATANNLTINATATLTNIAAGIINIYGNLTNNGTYTDNGIYSSAGSLNLIGSTAQSITGATTFNNLTINSTSGVTLNNATTVNGILTLTAGTLTTNNNLTQNLYTGAIAGTGAGSTTGNIKFKKTVWGDRYHYIASPIPGLTMADWNDNVIIKSGANSNLFRYDETVVNTNPKIGWTAVTSTATSINTAQGYALFFPRFVYNTTLDVSGAYTHGASYSTASLTFSSSGTLASDGWNLVGNPFPSTIDWNAASGWTKPGTLANAIYMYDSRLLRYASYVGGAGNNGGTQYIGSMQGFFVKLSSGSGTLTFGPATRVTSTLIDVWRTASTDNVLRLTVSTGSNSDETVIRFMDNASEAYDDQLDAYKLYNDGDNPNVASVSPGTEYSINSLPTNLSNKTIPLKLTAAIDGAYSFKADLSQFTSGQQVTLEDRLLGITQNLTENPSYNCSLTKGDYADRFFLNYTQTVTETNNSNTKTSEIEIGSYQQQLFVLFPQQNSGEAKISVVDALGKQVFEQNNVDITGGKVEITLPVASGIYCVRVITATNSASQQVYITK